MAAVAIAVVGLASGVGVAAAHPGRTYIGPLAFDEPEGFPKHYLIRPHRFRVPSADSMVTFKHLTWKNWGGSRAVGVGGVKACGEGGPEGYVCKSGHVRLVASKLGRCPEAAYYEALKASYIPLYGARNISIPVARRYC